MNNTLTLPFDNTFPDLDFTVSGITPLLTCISDGNFSGTFTVQIINNGNGPVTDDFRIDVDDDQGWTSQHWYNTDLGGTLPLAVASSEIVYIPWTRDFTSEPYIFNFPNISVDLDASSVICECSVASNSSTTSYDISFPNMRVTSIIPTCISDGIFSVEVIVDNNGYLQANNVVVRLSDNDGQSSDQVVPLINVGASVSLTFSPWQVDGNPVPFIFTATVDPGSLICELSGNDNTVNYSHLSGNLDIGDIFISGQNSDGTFQVGMNINNTGSGIVDVDFIVRLSDSEGHSQDRSFTSIGGTLPINAGTQQTVIFDNWVIAGDPAAFEFTGVLDPTHQICETSPIDNTVTNKIVPTLTEWATIAFISLLGIIGAWYIRRMIV